MSIPSEILARAAIGPLLDLLKEREPSIIYLAVVVATADGTLAAAEKVNHSLLGSGPILSDELLSLCAESILARFRAQLREGN